MSQSSSHTGNETFPTPNATASTCDSSTRDPLRQLTLFAADHPASRSATPGANLARQTTATSGRKCIESFESLTQCPAPLFLRMCVASEIWFSPKYLLTWKLRDTASGTYYEFHLRHSVPRISEREYSLWPTPTVSGNYNRKGASPNSGDGLATACKLETWATPTARDWRNGAASEATLTRNSRPLSEQVTEVEAANLLNPDWELALMGFPPGWLNLDGPPGEASPNTTGSRRAPVPPSQAAPTVWQPSAMLFRRCTHIRYGLH